MLNRKKLLTLPLIALFFIVAAASFVVSETQVAMAGCGGPDPGCHGNCGLWSCSGEACCGIRAYPGGPCQPDPDCGCCWDPQE